MGRGGSWWRSGAETRKAQMESALRWRTRFMFLVAERFCSTGCTMLWMKWKRAVTRRQRFFSSLANRFSGSRLVSPVCRERTKKSIAETEPTLFSSSSSVLRRR